MQIYSRKHKHETIGKHCIFYTLWQSATAVPPLNYSRFSPAKHFPSANFPSRFIIPALLAKDCSSLSQFRGWPLASRISAESGELQLQKEREKMCARNLKIHEDYVLNQRRSSSFLLLTIVKRYKSDPFSTFRRCREIWMAAKRFRRILRVGQS